MDKVARIRRVVSEVLGRELTEAEDDHHFDEDLGLDSLDQVTIAMGLEEAFNIQIPDGQIENLMSIRDIILYMGGE